MPFRPLVVIASALLIVLRAPAAGADEPGVVQSVGLRAAYGIGARDNLRFVSLVPRVSLFFPRLIDEPLAAHHWRPEFIIEPIVSYISNSTDTIEAGITPLFFSLRYDRGQPLVPFLEGGEGLLYSDLRGERLGTRFQFSSQGGAGLHWFLDRTTALTISYRLRHISNAGISRENQGLNTHFFTIGLTVFPSR